MLFGGLTVIHGFTRSNFLFALLSFAVLALPAVSRAGGVPLTQCGQNLQGQNRAYLTADLDCQNADFGVAFPGSGTLELRGFTLKNTSGFGVSCQTTCKIVGPGSIRDSATPYSSGVSGGKVMLLGATVADHSTDGVDATRLVVLRDSVVQGNGRDGVKGMRVKARNSSVIDNGRNGIFLPNTYPSGVAPNPQLKLEDVVATGNGMSVAHCAGEDVCADVNSPVPPMVRGALTCDTSYNPTVNADLDVCAQD